MNPSQVGLATSLDLPGYLLGGSVLLLVMVFHGAVLLQIAKRYEVKSFLYLAEKKYSAVALCFYVSVFLLFLTHIAEILIWGTALYVFKLLPALGQSILFSGSTYTAMGFMEDILPDGWKMLAVIIAFSGMFSFAWTASVMISMTKSFRQAYTKLHMRKLKIPSDIIDRFE
uniref:Ion transport 2 domain protein n=1 Tax=Polynucleobacter necessarius subsp. necessarius (strain STIR1) TaxID=452638 RepID=B1XU19_POLNS